MSRIDNFKKLENHAWLKKSFKKLNKDNIDFCLSFLDQNEKKDKNELALKIVRLFLDKQKPKAWKEIEELLICSL